ncbi:uncharacterized protein A4U43_C08F19130 [Asparagus officinalis]|nr:uncharacterized protein A4U43_C08F19130 [Asparagus officinalis]
MREIEVETGVFHVDDRSLAREEGVDLHRVEAEIESLGGGDILMETEVSTRGERDPDALTESIHHQGKELVAVLVSPSEEYGWLYPHRVNKIGSKTWDRLRVVLIGSPKVGPRYEKEPTLENRY